MAAHYNVPMDFEGEALARDGLLWMEDDEKEEDWNSGRSAPERVRSPPVDGLGFSINGRRVHVPPGGGATELKLRFHPSGSSSGFVTVHVTSRAAVEAPPPPCAAAPIITGVVFGRAAHEVLEGHRNSAVTPMHSSPPKAPATPILVTQKYIPKVPARPFMCTACTSLYKLISELRGFICLCSPVIADSMNKLKMLRKKKNDKKRHRKKGKKSTAGAAAPRESADGNESSGAGAPGPAAASPSPRPAAPPESWPGPVSPRRAVPERGKLVIMADDFYYGRDPGRGERVDHQRRYAGSYRCLHCPENVHNNIQLMSHLKTHGNKMAEDYCRANPVTACPRCFRRFSCPLGLRRHAEAVHARGAPNAKCEICELDFPTEPNFLRHMKSKHKPGEMPYVCQVCDFRSSFYSDVWSHFEEFHANTANLMCPYCLKILRNSLCYMHHFASHQVRRARTQ